MDVGGRGYGLGCGVVVGYMMVQLLRRIVHVRFELLHTVGIWTWAPLGFGRGIGRTTVIVLLLMLFHGGKNCGV